MARRDVKVKIKLTGLNKFMRSAPIQDNVNAEAARTAARAGSKYRIRPLTTRYTARAFVEMKPEERETDADRIALLRALGGS